MKLSETDSRYEDRERLALTTLEYYVETEGNFIAEPIVKLFCRDSHGNRRIVEVEDFHPFFYVREDAISRYEDDLFTESMIRTIETTEGVVSEDNTHNKSLELTSEPPRTTLDGEPLARIYTVKPEHVSDLKTYFDETWEADVFFTNRFLIDNGIKHGFSVPEGKTTVSADEIEPTAAPTVKPRIVCVDIEVWTGGVFPDPVDANQPVTAVTAYDSYDDEYAVYALHPDGTQVEEDHDWPSYESLDDGTFNSIDWPLPEGVEPEQTTFKIFDNEAYMLGSLNQWIIDKDPDLLTGWNSSSNDKGSGFDYPYIINRCQNIGEGTYEDLSPTGTCFVTNHGSAVVGGRELFDMLQAYKKTQIHEKPSYALGAIAQDELGYGKEDLESTDQGWLHSPKNFMRYNIRDVQAVIDIEAEKSVVDMYDHIRSIAGSTYGEIADSNIGIIDVLFLRQAKERGYALPTSSRPDVQHYWGAYVFDPVPGRHENVVYPDLSSLYPNLFRDMNASPETIVGDEEALEESQYDESDCHTIYVDPRSEQMKRDADKPERKKLYVLKPEVKESFVREIVQDLIDMKYEYKKDEYSSEAYAAVKRITNSVYGVMGDSVSYGSGFRLFDWRIAEAITLAGRDVIKHTAETFDDQLRSMGYTDGETIAGDSVPAEEPVILKRDGSVSIEPIHNTSVGDEVWSDGGFTTVKDVIQKPNRKQCYTVRTQTGIVHTTSDHGLLYPDGTEVTPRNVSIGEDLMHEDVSGVELPTSIDVSDEEAWLLGVFCAEGSAGIYETGSKYDDYKAQVKVSNQEMELLERVVDSFSDVYSFETKIYDDMESSNVYNVKSAFNNDYELLEMAARLREWCYTDDGEKMVPQHIINSSTSARKAFLDGFHAGDGHIKKGNYEELKEYDEMWSKSPALLQGIVVLLRDMGIDVSLSWRDNHNSQYYRVRCPNFRRVGATECREVEMYEYTGEYVYDLETENHHFAAGVGSIVVHNTDSCVRSLPSAQSMDETLEAAHDAAEYVDGTYPDFMKERFGIGDGHMAVEIESYAEAALFMDKKKRYAQWIRWDEGDEVDEVEHKGFELVRSDSSQLTTEAQEAVIKMILCEDDPKQSVKDYLLERWNTTIDGRINLEDVGRPSAINNQLWDYGWSVSTVDADETVYSVEGEKLDRGDEYVKFYTPQPHIRGARYANEHIDGESLRQGSKPLFFYIKGIAIASDLPETYSYENQSLNAPDDVSYADAREIKELDTEVDAISLEDVRNMPDDAAPDWEKMAEKSLRDPIEPIVETVGWDFDDLVTDGEQTGLAQFM